jgi:hypothetical protein
MEGFIIRNAENSRFLKRGAKVELIPRIRCFRIDYFRIVKSITQWLTLDFDATSKAI